MAGLALIVLFVLYFLVLPRLATQNRRGNGKPNLPPTPENVEPHIYPLVAALNATRLCVTRASCDGHWESLFYISQPYLAFSGDTRLAEKLDALLYLETELPWNLSAGFAMPDRELWFRLELNMDILWNYRIFWPWRRRKFRRQQDRDVRHLAHLVQAIAMDIQQPTFFEYSPLTKWRDIMPSPNQRNQQQSTGVAIPINLVHETIAYLESQGDPKAVILKQHYLHWLAMSVQPRRIGQRPMKG